MRYMKPIQCVVLIGSLIQSLSVVDAGARRAPESSAAYRAVADAGVAADEISTPLKVDRLDAGIDYDRSCECDDRAGGYGIYLGRGSDLDSGGVSLVCGDYEQQYSQADAGRDGEHLHAAEWVQRDGALWWQGAGLEWHDARCEGPSDGGRACAARCVAAGVARSEGADHGAGGLV